MKAIDQETAEQGALSCLLQDPRLVSQSVTRIMPPMFRDKGRLTIYRVIIELFWAREPVDIMTLSMVLGSRGMLPVAGGSGGIAELLSFAPSAEMFDEYTQALTRA